MSEELKKGVQALDDSELEGVAGGWWGCGTPKEEPKKMAVVTTYLPGGHESELVLDLSDPEQKKELKRYQELNRDYKKFSKTNVTMFKISYYEE